MPEPLFCIVGRYSLHLYCYCENNEHEFGEFPHELTGETYGECIKEARMMGWKINTRLRIALCPKCRKKTIRQALKERGVEESEVA